MKNIIFVFAVFFAACGCNGELLEVDILDPIKYEQSPAQSCDTCQDIMGKRWNIQRACTSAQLYRDIRFQPNGLRDFWKSQRDENCQPINIEYFPQSGKWEFVTDEVNFPEAVCVVRFFDSQEIPHDGFTPANGYLMPFNYISCDTIIMGNTWIMTN